MNSVNIIEQKPVGLKCQRCNHEWNYKGKNVYVATCPHCRTYVSIKKYKMLLIGKEAKPKQSAESITTTNKEVVCNHG